MFLQFSFIPDNSWWKNEPSELQIVHTAYHSTYGSAGSDSIDKFIASELDGATDLTFANTIAKKLTTFTTDCTTHLINLSDESTFQLSLEDLVEGSFCCFREVTQSYGFGNTKNRAEGNSSTHSFVYLNSLFSNNNPWFTNNDKDVGFVFEKPKETPLLGPCDFKLKPDNPFYNGVHSEIQPYIEHIKLQNFLRVGSCLKDVFELVDLYHNSNFLEYFSSDDTKRKYIELTSDEVYASFLYYMKEYEPIMKYEGMYGSIFEAYRKFALEASILHRNDKKMKQI